MDNENDEVTEIQNIVVLDKVLESDGSLQEISSPNKVLESDGIAKVTPSNNYRQNIEEALSLNKYMDDKLKELEEIFVRRLTECRQKLANIRASSNNSYKHDNGQGIFNYLRCGKPYFKDPKDLCPAPDNTDTIIKKTSGIYNAIDIKRTTAWTAKDKETFLKVIENLSRNIRRKKIHSELSQYNSVCKDSMTLEISKRINDLNREFEVLERLTLQDIALPLDMEYDWNLVSKKLHDRHNPHECKALWKLFLHPCINKNIWDREEQIKLRTIAEKYSSQNWDAIAKELNTGRSSYQCFVQYRTSKHCRSSDNKWTPAESEYLIRLVDHFKNDKYIPWSKIATHMHQRTKLQIYNKYTRMSMKKGRFLPEEDAVLLTYVNKYGPDFKKISYHMSGRSAEQLRCRYKTLCGSNGLSIVWTVEDDKKLLQLISNQEDGVNYSTLVPHFNGKNRVNIRTRHMTLVKWMKRYPKADISLAPRRQARQLYHGQAKNDLSDAVFELKKTKVKVESTVKRKRGYEQSTHEDIDHNIETFLRNEFVGLENSNETPAIDSNNQVSDDNAVNDLKKLLILLRSRLVKPTFHPRTIYPSKWIALFTAGETKKYVKTYSKTVKTKPAVEPDIWGNKQLDTSKYYFPPHFTTITGLKKLMYLVRTERGLAKFNKYKRLSSTNGVFKAQWLLLMERFQFLFLWPMLLSNHSPMQLSFYKGQLANTFELVEI